MIENNHNFKLYINWESIAKSEADKAIFTKRMYRGISDQVYTYFISGSKQNPEKILKVDKNTGEVKEVYKEPYRYLYCSSFTKTQAAADLHISRPTLDKHLQDLFDIGLIEEHEKYNPEKKKKVKVWHFPHFQWAWFVNAKVCAALAEIGLYKDDTMKKGTSFHGIVRLLFELKRISNLREEDRLIRQQDLLAYIAWPNTQTNRLRLMNYMVLLAGLDLLDFEIVKLEKGSVYQNAYRINAVYDQWNSKIEHYLELIKDEQVNQFIEDEKQVYRFDINNVINNY